MTKAIDTERRLIAIFAADVEGYSRLMGADEVGTMRDLTQRRTILDRLIETHRGRIANTAEDTWKIRDGMHQTNKLISTRCATDRKCTYVDPWPSMIGKDGTPKPEFFVEDGLHMTPEGYKAWTHML